MTVHSNVPGQSLERRQTSVQWPMLQEYERHSLSLLQRAPRLAPGRSVTQRDRRIVFWSTSTLRGIQVWPGPQSRSRSHASPGMDVTSVHSLRRQKKPSPHSTSVWQGGAQKLLRHWSAPSHSEDSPQDSPICWPPPQPSETIVVKTMSPTNNEMGCDWMQRARAGERASNRWLSWLSCQQFSCRQFSCQQWCRQ